MLIKLDDIDSTNNYAMHLIDGNKAHHGLTVLAARQSSGKGQRGRTWTDTPGQSLLMSTILQPEHTIDQQFQFNTSVATTIAQQVQQWLPAATVRIKWPNDIIVNDKKAGGILIENVLRGATWAYAVVGFGLNINQESMPGLPFATSLHMVTGETYVIDELALAITQALVSSLTGKPMDKLDTYRQLLYGKGRQQVLIAPNGERQVYTIVDVNNNGTLSVQDPAGNM
ncbi:MAG: biotin--[acetyl-CoA-carboxylase] ligase, partial [Chitinophagia bacterium]|nr:biotin--[acetyl-CoA-carboxylase] ligase [Chitinophagia bacterium]